MKNTDLIDVFIKKYFKNFAKKFWPSFSHLLFQFFPFLNKFDFCRTFSYYDDEKYFRSFLKLVLTWKSLLDCEEKNIYFIN